ncbi:hypothetical protein LLG95_15645 [bacterium]|nr:hypothetical protein [bacterium]
MSIAQDTQPTPPAKTSPLIPWAPVLCLALVFLSWLPALSIGLEADDFYFYSPKVTDHPFSYFARDVLDTPDSLFLRPIPILLYALETRLHFSAPAAHAVSIAIHLMNTLLVAAFVLMLVPGAGVRSHAFPITAAMLFFGCHPQAPGAVGWIGSRFDLIGCFFGGLGLLLWMRSYRSPRWMPLTIAALAAFAAALFTKEPCIAFAAAAFVASMLEWRSSGKGGVAGRLARPVALAVVTGAYLAWRTYVLGGIGGHAVSHKTFNVAAAFWYAVADFWPPLQVPNALSAPTIGLVVAAAILIVASRQTGPAAQALDFKALVTLAALLAFGLALCVSFPMDRNLILRRAESRISYGHVFAIAVMLGMLLGRVRAGWTSWACRVLCLVMLLPAIPLQQQWIGYWKEADDTVQSILRQTQQLVPNPPPSPTFVYWGVPLTTKHYCYVFGYGLPEALAIKYGRGDIRVIRYGGEEQKLHPTPDMIRFDYNWDRDKLRLIPPEAR